MLRPKAKIVNLITKNKIHIAFKPVWNSKFVAYKEHLMKKQNNDGKHISLICASKAGTCHGITLVNAMA